MHRRLLSSVVVLAAATSSFAAAPVAATYTAAGAATQSGVRVSARPFSPNGDGVRDTTVIRLHLPRRSDGVTLRIARPDSPSRPFREVNLGPVGAGTHTWTWDGRRDDGTKVGDGTFRVAVGLTGATWPDTAGTVVVDRTFSPGIAPAPEFAVPTGRAPAVFPRTTVVRDHVTLEDTGLRAYPADPAVGLAGLRLEIRDRGGRLVLREPLSRKSEEEPWFSFAWTARVDGRPLPPGRYRAVVNGRDSAGNHGPSAPLRLWVSRERLEWRHDPVTVLPAGSTVGSCFFDAGSGCDGGSGSSCGTVVASDRFPSGLSYRSGICDPVLTGGTPAAGEVHWLPLPDAIPGRGVSRARVAFTGAPTQPGEADLGTLQVLARDYDDSAAVSASTGAETTDVVPLYWNGVSADYSESADGLPPGVAWTFGTRGGAAVDVEEFIVAARYLAVAD